MPGNLPRNVLLGRIIATRRFRVRDHPDETAELRIGTPRDFNGDAYCPVQLAGVGDEKIRPIFGVDRVQALQLAVRFLEPLLLRFGDELWWEDEPAHRSLNSDPWSPFEGTGLAEFLSEFAALCSKYAARARPSRNAPDGRKRKRR